MSTLGRRKKSARGERGIALIVAMLSLLLVGAITAGVIILSNTETRISSNFRDEQRAFFSAKAGIEEARDRLRTAATDTLRTAGTLPTTAPGNPNSVLYILNPNAGEVVAPWAGALNNYPDDEICKENTTIPCVTVQAGKPMPSGSGWYTTKLASGAYASNPILDWKWARVTLKYNNSVAPYYTNGSNVSVPVCWNGIYEYASVGGCAPPNLPVYLITSLAVTPSGSRRMVQTEVAEDTLNFNAPSPLTLDSGPTGVPGDTFAGPNGNNFQVDGHDHPGCGAPATSQVLPGVGVTNGPDIVNVINGIPGNRQTHYTGSGAGTPDVQNIAPTLPPNLQSVQSLQNYLSQVKADVTQPVLTPPPGQAITNLSNPGTPSAPQIIYVNGDLNLSGNVTGYGILVVTGQFTASGNVGWNGLVLVVGKGIFQGNGGGNNSYNGAIVVAKTVDAQGNPLPTLGPATFQFNGGGNNGVNYSSGCIAQATTLSTFHVVSARELMN